MPSTKPSNNRSSNDRGGWRTVTATGTALGLATAVLNVAVVLALYDQYGYPFPEGAALVGFVATLAAFGFVPGFVSGHTRLGIPALGFLAFLAGVTIAEVTSPAPEWGQLGDFTVVHGEVYINRWANRQSVLVALLLAGGVAEFGVRSAYNLADDRLRNLPGLPFSPYVVAWVAGGFGALFGTTVALMVWRIGASPTGIELVVFACATLAAAVPLAALLARGLVVPLILFLLVVPRPLLREVFVGTDSPLFLILLGPFALVFAIAGAVEYYVRTRARDDGGVGVESPD